MRGKLRLIAVVAALAAVAASTGAAAGASHRVVKDVQEDATAASWSPDGKQIAFAYVPYVPYSQRYRIVRTSSKPGGAVHTVVAAQGHCCGGLQWTPGGQILFSTGVGLRHVPMLGGKSKRLFFPGCPNTHGCQVLGPFILSPNREYAASSIGSDFSVPDGGWEIGLVRLESGQSPAVAPWSDPATDDLPLTFSPDSTQLVFLRGGTLMALNLTTGDSVPLAESRIPGAALVSSDATVQWSTEPQLEWSPDGNWVAYLKDDRYNQNLEVAPTNGSAAPHELATCGRDSDLHFSWSPTSKLLAYTCYSGTSRTQFMTVRPDGVDRTDLLRGRAVTYVENQLPGPQWSPDGLRLLFLAYGRSYVRVWTIRPDGSHLVRIG